MKLAQFSKHLHLGVCFLTLVVASTVVPSANGALLGLDLSDTLITYDSTGTITYDSDTDLFALDATPAAVRFASGIVRFIGDPRSMQIRVLVNEMGSVSSNGTVDDLVLQGSIDYDGDGVADFVDTLTGRVLAFGFEDTGIVTDRYDFLFEATGGLLADLLPHQLIGVTVTSENSSFEGTFDVDFEGRAKGYIGFHCALRNIQGQVYCCRDDQHPFIEQVVVTAFDANGVEVGSAVTDPNGLYVIGGLLPGNYTVVVTLPDGAEACFDTTVEVTTTCEQDGIANFCVCEDAECGPCEGKVTELTLQYNGTLPNARIKVVQKKDNVLVFDDIVQPGETFTVVGTDKHGTLGTEIWIMVNCRFNAKIHTSCSQPIGPGLVRGDFEVISGVSKEGGLLCPVPPLPPEDKCGKCEGKVRRLRLRYRGTIQNAHIQVVQKKDGIVVFDDVVQPGDTFGFVGADKKGTLGTEIMIRVNNRVRARFHTSCSKPIGPGLIQGDFEVIDGDSREGGALCRLRWGSDDD